MVLPQIDAFFGALIEGEPELRAAVAAHLAHLLYMIPDERDAQRMTEAFLGMMLQVMEQSELRRVLYQQLLAHPAATTQQAK